MIMRVWMDKCKNTEIYRGSCRHCIIPYALSGCLALACMCVLLSVSVYPSCGTVSEVDSPTLL
jgi:hypothetical protein